MAPGRLPGSPALTPHYILLENKINPAREPSLTTPQSGTSDVHVTTDQPRNGTAAGRLLNLLHRRGRMTRAQLTTESGLARSAVGTALAELTDLGLIQTGPSGRPADTPLTPGRPS